MTQAAILAASGSPGTTTGFKNRLINGAMNLWQRGTSVTANSAVTWLADRWSGCQFANQTLSQSSSVPSGQNFQYSLKAQRPASGSGLGLINIAQSIEYQNMYDLAGQSVTFSFWALAGANFSASGSTLGVQLQTGTTADQGTAYPYYSWTGVTQPINTTTTISTTWTKYTFTGTIPSNAKELIVVLYYTPTGTAGADDAFYATGLQLEVGTTATNFDFRSYGTELQLCQRYYAKLQNDGTGGDTALAFGMQTATTNSSFCVTYPVTMRSEPTVAGSNIAISDFVAFTNALTLSGIQAGYNTANVYGTNTASGAQFRPVFMAIINNTAGFLTLSAEL